MIISQFNTFFYHEGSMIGYNALSNEFIILELELFELYQAAIAEKKISELNDIHPGFYKHIKDKGFIINKNTDEIQSVKKLVASIDQNDKIYELIINPTMNCNFKCWYCYETHIKDSKMSSSIIENVILFIKSILENNNLKQFHLSWFGGEPLLYYDKTILPILEKIYPLIKLKGIEFSSNFTTNGLLVNQKILTDCNLFGVNHFQITLDGHRERHNKVRFVNKERGSYDEIINNIKLILKNKINVTVRLNISEETLNGKITEIIKDFSDLTSQQRKLLNFSFHKVWQEEKNIENEMSKIIDEFKINKLSTQTIDEVDHVRNSCYADKKNQATINYNGEVFKCTARDFKSENKEGILQDNGSILWNEKYYQRMNAKFKNQPCIECKILPICNGSCSQLSIESKNEEYCIHDFDEDKKTMVVKNIFLNALN
ncbi:radical SAM/SPASM domain-containing protein [Flavobacterium aquidurense]|uniref:Radical SAM domain protein n=1 Tax=Flavobacterium aquidurense TaxID=362413 RepID=A0A0Q0XPJ0_9FLAO|nr:radical SAM protein [Flavobacterium aquidurense]KQB37786.1 Radical SAM domain protein [Flavobacterium aquidurense]